MPAAPAASASSQPLGPARAAGEPERQAELAHLREVDHVARRRRRGSPRSLRRRLAARRRVVPAGRGALDDEAVDAPGRLRASDGRERCCSRRWQEARARARAAGAVPVTAGSKRRYSTAAGAAALDVEPQLRRLVLRQRVERRRDLARDAGAHEHVVHAGEHRAVERGEVRHLDLGQQVDADRRRRGPPCARIDLDERREDRELLAGAARRAACTSAAGDTALPGAAARRGGSSAPARPRRRRGSGTAPSRGACGRRRRPPGAAAPAPCRSRCPRPRPAGRAARRRGRAASRRRRRPSRPG